MAVAVVFGVWLALSQGLYLASLAGILVPVLYTIKAMIPRRERKYTSNLPLLVMSRPALTDRL